MKAYKQHVISILLSLASAIAASAQSPISIVDHIVAGRVNTVVQPDSLTRLLAPPVKSIPATEPDESVSDAVHDGKPSGNVVKMVGYRVQVFSDNNPRTAKNEARTKQRSISGRFPQYRTYVAFTSPYWRLKVGDFRTQHEAQEAAEELKREFPAYSKEIRVVRDRVNITN